MQTTNKLMTLIKKVIQLKDDQYIENLTFKVMDQIEAENEPGWKAAQERKNASQRSWKNSWRPVEARQDAWTRNQPAGQCMQDRS